jgi:archaellum component FlaC
MEKNINQISETVNDIKQLFHSFSASLENIEKRLARLEKMDSIEHRVAVNQIDLSDIKESLERIEARQTDEILKAVKEIREATGGAANEDIKYINRRLDSHLVKLAKAEEELLILKNSR